MFRNKTWKEWDLNLNKSTKFDFIKTRAFCHIQDMLTVSTTNFSLNISLNKVSKYEAYY